MNVLSNQHWITNRGTWSCLNAVLVANPVNTDCDISKIIVDHQGNMISYMN